MSYQGKAFQLTVDDQGLAELVFNLQGESVNKFNRLAVEELAEVLNSIEQDPGIRGLLIVSAKPVFVVGADITEFVPLFDRPVEQVVEFMRLNNKNFCRMESLAMPVVVAINGFALGGGLEFCLACDFRVMSSAAAVGLPEVSLGIIPGWGGTARLPRVIDPAVAVEWIAGGAQHNATAALAAGCVDAVVEPDALQSTARDWLAQAMAGTLDYAARRASKQQPLQLTDDQKNQIFVASPLVQKMRARAALMPASFTAIEVVAKAAGLTLAQALEIEAEGIAQLFPTDSAKALVGNFINDQMIAKKAKRLAASAEQSIVRAAVLGAGIMGGGIAYQSALKGIPAKMKDVNQAGLDLGMEEAQSLLAKRVKRGLMAQEKASAVIASIEPMLTYDNFAETDIVVEAVVENPAIKKRVLAEVEEQVSETAILCSNTSTILIGDLATALKRPENFCGMHFFNPVHAMPLVEVIRGPKTSSETIAATVAYALALGKKAIVVNDSPGFLVNRTLFPYFRGVADLIREGVDFQYIDQVMEAWGWPMGPAYLMDVVGLDTCVHCEEVMAAGFADNRLAKLEPAACDRLSAAGRLGQKNGKGFYDYLPGASGRIERVVNDEVYTLLGYSSKGKPVPEEEVIARCLIPMATEMARCLEEGIVDSPAEADMALLYGLGFPAFRGGIVRWMDSLRLAEFVKLAGRYQALGKVYQATEQQVAMARNGDRYYRL